MVRTMNSYESNLIEGHVTLPRDIERALAGDYSNEPAKIPTVATSASWKVGQWAVTPGPYSGEWEFADEPPGTLYEYHTMTQTRNRKSSSWAIGQNKKTMFDAPSNGTYPLLATVRRIDLVKEGMIISIHLSPGVHFDK